ncbi:MAG TPA: polysaccharide biosynthesis C-terminal domain-containing protein, partial [Ignavibacteria bacterium]
ISNFIASFITFLLLLTVIIKNNSFSYNKELIGELKRFSLPYLPAALASMAVQVINIPIMQYLTDVKTVGIYNANYKLGIFMMLVVSMFEYAWRPFFLNNAKEPDAKALFAKVLTIFIGAASVIFILLSFTIEDLIKIPFGSRGYIIGQKYWEGIYIVPIILLAYMFLGVYTNLLAGIYIEKKTKYLPFITGLGAAINIVCGFTLIPVIGMIGGAIAVFMSYLSMAIYIYAVSQKFYPVKYETGKILMLMVLNLIAFALFYVDFSLHIPIYLSIIIALILCTISVSISGLWKAKMLFAKKRISNSNIPPPEPPTIIEI